MEERSPDLLTLEDLTIRLSLNVGKELALTRWITSQKIAVPTSWRMPEIRQVISSSSFYWASMGNAPNVLQPYWLIVLPLDFPDLTASLLL